MSDDLDDLDPAVKRAFDAIDGSLIPAWFKESMQQAQIIDALNRYEQRRIIVCHSADQDKIDAALRALKADDPLLTVGFVVDDRVTEPGTAYFVDLNETEKILTRAPMQSFQEFERERGITRITSATA